MKEGFEGQVNQNVADALRKSWPLNEKLVHFLNGIKNERVGGAQIAITPLTARGETVGVDITVSKDKTALTLGIDLNIGGQYLLTEAEGASEPMGGNTAFLRIQQWLSDQGDAMGANFLDQIHRNNEAAATAAVEAARRSGAKAPRRDPKSM